MKLIIIGILLIILCTCIAASAQQPTIDVSPQQINVDFAFNIPKSSNPHYSKTVSLDISNNGDSELIIYSITSSNPNSYITITVLNNQQFSIPNGSSKSISISVSADKESGEGTYTGYISIVSNAETKEVDIKVTITHYASIEVIPSTLSFGRVGRTQTPTETLTIKETLGYKSAENIQITKISGNNWINVGSYPSTIPAGGSINVDFTMIESKNPDYNNYTWKYQISSSNAGSAEVTINAYLLLPAKLGDIPNFEVSFLFNKPKGTVSRYRNNVYIKLKNIGDETLNLSSYSLKIIKVPSGGIYFDVSNIPSTITIQGKETKEVKLTVNAPYDTPEGIYNGKILVDAGSAGSDYSEITIKIEWGVEVSISPLKIDFESVEVKKSKSKAVHIQELIGYKSVKVDLSKISGGGWLDISKTSLIVPAGKSTKIDLTLAPRGDAIPGKTYKWKYYVKIQYIGTKIIEVSAKILPIDLTELKNNIQNMRRTPIYKKYTEVENIISNSADMLYQSEKRPISTEDWKHVPQVGSGVSLLLNSLNDAEVLIDNGEHNNAFKEIVMASVSSEIIKVHANLISDKEVRKYAVAIQQNTKSLMNTIQTNSAIYFEKEAILKQSENLIESEKAYRNAATLFHLLGNTEKELKYKNKAYRMLIEHDKLVEEANNGRIKAAHLINNIKESEMINILGKSLLLNPFNYDTTIEGYNTAKSMYTNASRQYRLAGELLLNKDTEEELKSLENSMRSILIIFYFACVFYAIIFVYSIKRIIIGMMDYWNDINEKDLGNYLGVRGKV